MFINLIYIFMKTHGKLIKSILVTIGCLIVWFSVVDLNNTSVEMTNKRVPFSFTKFKVKDVGDSMESF